MTGNRQVLTFGKARPEDLAALCQACGLCCDGSLFGRVSLEPDEVKSAKHHRLRIVGNDTAFEQPCPALHATSGGHTCSIYDDRPRACHNFVCRLLERFRHEGGALEPRLAAVHRVRELMQELIDAGWTAATLNDSAPEPIARAHAELMQRLEDDFARA